MRRLADIIAAVLESIKTVWTPVFKAGRWTLEASTAIVAAPIRVAGSAVAWTADTAVEIATAPVRMLGAVLGGGGRGRGGPGTQAAASAAEATQRAEAVVQTDKTTTSAIDVAKIVARAARFRVHGHDPAPLLAELPEALADYVRRLSEDECKAVGAMEIGHLVGLVAEGRPLPGVRSAAELIAVHSPAPAASVSVAEERVLSSLRDRLIARVQQDSDIDAPDRKLA